MAVLYQSPPSICRSAILTPWKSQRKNTKVIRKQQNKNTQKFCFKVAGQEILGVPGHALSGPVNFKALLISC